MKHGVLKAIHPMLGCDRHIPWPPGSPSPLTAPASYFTIYTMLGTSLTATYTTKLFTDSMFPTMIKGTDIGPLIPHIGTPSVTLPVEMVFSSSKSHFGSSRYKTEKGPAAVSLFYAINPNLNCGTPLPTPTGFVLALATHRVDMTWGDLFAGVMNMVVDFIIQKFLNKWGSKFGDWLGKKLSDRVLNRLFQACLKDWGPMAGTELAQVVAGLQARGMLTEALSFLPLAKYGGTAAGTALAFFVGGPMGADIGTFGGYGDDPTGSALTPGGTPANISNAGYNAMGEAIDKATGEAMTPEQAQQEYLNHPPEWNVF
jgi:hypothetical protein